MIISLKKIRFIPKLLAMGLAVLIDLIWKNRSFFMQILLTSKKTADIIKTQISFGEESQ